MSHVVGWLVVGGLFFPTFQTPKRSELAWMESGWDLDVVGVRLYQFVQTSQVRVGWHLSGVHCYGMMRMREWSFRCCEDGVEGC